MSSCLVIETPRPRTGFDQFVDVPENGLNYNYLKVSQFATNKIGYKTVDLQASKSVGLPGGTSVQLRLDVLNAFNTRNYAFQNDGFPGRPYYVTDGDISGVTRTLKFTMNVKF
jgi:hypothetical protein